MNVPNGVQIHGMCVISSFDYAPIVGNSIVDMYSKCGRIKEAMTMFNVLPVRTLISWNTIIAGYTLAGQGKAAIAGSLIDLYVKCGNVVGAQKVFN
ncbi:hypothetical protein CRYUN_Cryun15aG0054000 [Craigia yunnanensis]